MTTQTMKKKRTQSNLSLIWRRFRKHKLAMISLVVLLALIFVAIFAHLIAPYSPSEINPAKLYGSASSQHLFGTDALGRDIFSRVLYAGRVSLLVGFAVAAISAIIGSLMGLLAGYFSGQPLFLSIGIGSNAFHRFKIAEGITFWPKVIIRWLIWAAIIFFIIKTTGQFASTFSGTGVIITWIIGISLSVFIAYFAFYRVIRADLDSIISRLIDIMLSLPQIPILLVLAGLLANPEVGLGTSLDKIFGSNRSIVIIIFVLSLFNWLSIARLIRSTVLTLRQQEFIDAARALGGSNSRIMFRHLLPNTIAPIIVQVTLDVGNAILSEAALSFLGFGIQEPTASWGNMLTSAQEAIFQNPLAVFWPGMFILITVLAINFLGDGLRDALDPRSRL